MVSSAGSLQFLALHNFEVPFAGELASAVAGLPHLEELYLAPFRVPADQPFSFTKLWPSLQNLHTLVLDVISEGGFEAPVKSTRPPSYKAPSFVLALHGRGSCVVLPRPMLLSSCAS